MIININSHDVIIDDEDYNKIKLFNWSLNKKTKYICYKIYVNTKKSICVYLHSLIMGLHIGLDTDHINGNRLDNRKCNLRICTRSQNLMNSKKRDMNCSSKYKGVQWNKRSKRWRVRITKNYVRYQIGLFKDEIEAAKAYNEAAKIYHGEYARLNEV